MPSHKAVHVKSAGAPLELAEVETTPPARGEVRISVGACGICGTDAHFVSGDFPDQWELYKKERPATAADEIVRWATPVTSFQRTALEDYELSGVQIKKGQRVVMVYRSANFDEEVFDDPFAFNILRDPNPHVGFGGTGAHYCIGANLARMTIDLMFNAIADAMPDLESIGTPERLRSGWLNGIKHWQVDYHSDASAKCPVAH